MGPSGPFRVTPVLHKGGILRQSLCVTIMHNSNDNRYRNEEHPRSRLEQHGVRSEVTLDARKGWTIRSPGVHENLDIDGRMVISEL